MFSISLGASSELVEDADAAETDEEIFKDAYNEK